MAFVSIVTADIAAGKPVDNDLMTQHKDNFDALNGSLGGQSAFDIPNGDMETDADSSGFPDNWTETTYPGGTASLATTSPLNGSQSMRFEHPGGGGNGGGYADSEYMPCGDRGPVTFGWLHKATAATMRNQVIVRWFDEDKVALAGADASTTLYNSITNPTSQEYFERGAIPPATARFFKLRLVGGESSVNVAGIAVFDGVHLLRKKIRFQEVSGAVAYVEFTDIHESKELELLIIGGTVSGGANFALQVSSDNGSTWLTTSTYYSAAMDATGTTGVAHFILGGTSTSPAYIKTKISALGVSGEYTKIDTNSSIRTITPGTINYNKQGIINATTVYNAIKIIDTTGGNIAAGQFILKELS